MTQTAYSLETLQWAFPSTPPPSAAKNANGLSMGPAKIHAFRPRSLKNLMDSAPGPDRSADTVRFAGQAARAGWTRDQVKAVLLDPSAPISAHCLDQADPERAADRAIGKAFEDLPADKPVSFLPSPYVWVPPEELPSLDWLLGHWLLREEVTFVVAPGGSGKTTFLAAVALSLVTGEDLVGKPVPGPPKRVWLWNLEDSIAMMTRSIQAAAKLYDVKPGDIADRLFLNAARDGSPLCTTRRTSAGLEVSEPVREALISALKEKEIDVLIVDPFVSSHDGNENDNGEMDRVAKAWCDVAQQAGCAVVLCHHTSKAGSSEVNTMSARGAVAMTAAARIVLVLNPMTVSEANRLGVEAEERWRLVQVTMDKSNRAPVENADWFRKTSVEIGLGDSAGVIRPWSPPKAAELIPEEYLPVIVTALAECDELERRKSAQSPGWAGYIIAEALGWAPPEKGSPDWGRLKRIVDELIRRRQVTEISVKDAKSKTVPILVVSNGDSPPAQGEVAASGGV
jgi:hypothetical protein